MDGRGGLPGLENNRLPTYRDVEVLDAPEEIDDGPAIKVRTTPYKNNDRNNSSENIIMRNLLRNQERK